MYHHQSNVIYYSLLRVYATATVMNTDSVASLEKAVSYLLTPPCCFLPYTHAHPIMSPLRFPFGNINDPTASACFFVSLSESTGGKFSSIFSCIISFMNAASSCYLNFINPIFSAYYVMMMWSM